MPANLSAGVKWHQSTRISLLGAHSRSHAHAHGTPSQPPCAQALRSLGVHLHQLARGGLPPRAADALLALAPLSRLVAFRLAGQGAPSCCRLLALIPSHADLHKC